MLMKRPSLMLSVILIVIRMWMVVSMMILRCRW